MGWLSTLADKEMAVFGTGLPHMATGKPPAQMGSNLSPVDARGWWLDNAISPAIAGDSCAAATQSLPVSQLGNALSSPAFLVATRLDPPMTRA